MDASRAFSSAGVMRETGRDQRCRGGVRFWLRLAGVARRPRCIRADGPGQLDQRRGRPLDVGFGRHRARLVPACVRAGPASRDRAPSRARSRLSSARHRRAATRRGHRDRLVELVRLRRPERVPRAWTRPTVSTAIAGQAWRTPLGGSIEAVTSRLLAGEHAIRPAPHAVPDGCRLRCAIADGAAPSRSDRFLDRLGWLALDAARDAMAKAGLAPRDSRLERTALFAATGGLRPRWNEMLPAL